MNSIGGLNGIGAPISNNQIGGESFIRHVGADKAIYRFTEGSGTTVRDDSHYGNNGTFGATTAAPTWRRNSLYFDGGDYVSLTGINHEITTGGLTFCLNVTNFTAQTFIYSQDTIQFRLYSNTNINFRYYTTVYGWIFTQPLSSVNIIQVTRDNSGKWECYVNGIAGNQNITDSVDITYNGSSSIRLSGSAGMYIGTIYSFRILNKGLSGIECQNEYLCNRFRGNN